MECERVAKKRSVWKAAMLHSSRNSRVVLIGVLALCATMMNSLVQAGNSMNAGESDPKRLKQDFGVRLDFAEADFYI